MKPTTPKKASRLLTGQAGASLQPLLSYANYLQQQSNHLRSSLSEPVASHIALANIQNGVATILVDSSTWLGKVRYLAPIIQQCLIKQGLQINKVEFKTDPHQRAARKIEAEPAVMSRSTSELLESFAGDVDNPRLQAALQRLAKHGKKP